MTLIELLRNVAYPEPDKNGNVVYHTASNDLIKETIKTLEYQKELLEQAKEIINFHANSLEMNQFDTTMEDNWLSNFTEKKEQE